MLKFKNLIFDTIVFIFLFLSLAMCFIVIRTNFLWGNVSIEQIFINMVEANNEAAYEIIKGYMLYALLPAILVCATLLYTVKKYRYLLIIAGICLIYCTYKLNVIGYMINQRSYSKFYEQEYVDPKNINFQFPDKKRNLIILHLESMEKDYTNKNLIGENLLPELSELTKQGITFDNFYQLRHQDYTLAGMLADYCAVPYKGLKTLDYTSFNNFLPALVCLPQILQQNGYNTYFMKGATLDFSRTGIFFSSHGMQDLVGEDELKERFGLDLQSNQGSQWGFKDSALYALAKQRLSEIAKNNKPFLFSLLSLDNHGPNLYVDDQCIKTDNPQKDVIRCADKMAADFVKWIMAQDFYENTTIVIAGDHIKTGDNDLFPNKKNRQIFNLILNPADKSLKPVEHQWTSFDLPPSILQAIGVKFGNAEFGLGRSLFEKAPTLYEKMGQELENELNKASKVYEQFNTIVMTFTPLYEPYSDWGKEINSVQEIKKYASFSDEAFNLVWLDTLSFTMPEQNSANITFDISFRMLFMVNRTRKIELFANKHKIAEWNFNDDVKQPIYKTVTFNRNILTDDNKLLLEFKMDNSGTSVVGVGLGVESFKFVNN